VDISDFQEQLAALYFRLNGYLVSGFIIHAPEGETNEKGEHRSSRGDIDLLAVRFPHNAEPEREIETSKYLGTSKDRIDFVICEVKGGKQPLQFNNKLRTEHEAVRSVLRWLGFIEEEKIEQILKDIIILLSTDYPKNPSTFREHIIPDTNFKIRAILFAPDRKKPTQKNQDRYIYSDEIMSYFWKCFRPLAKRNLCQVYYDFGLWGAHEKIVRYFKEKEGSDPGNITDLYELFQLTKRSNHTFNSDGGFCAALKSFASKIFRAC
jgi:hypothetical protein